MGGLTDSDEIRRASVGCIRQGPEVGSSEQGNKLSGFIRVRNVMPS
jgi:hypothetical protein